MALLPLGSSSQYIALEQLKGLSLFFETQLSTLDCTELVETSDGLAFSGLHEAKRLTSQELLESQGQCFYLLLLQACPGHTNSSDVFSPGISLVDISFSIAGIYCFLC